MVYRRQFLKTTKSTRVQVAFGATDLLFNKPRTFRVIIIVIMVFFFVYKNVEHETLTVTRDRLYLR